MNKFHTTLLSISLIIIGASCSRNQYIPDDSGATYEMYRELCDTYRAYTDSMKCATDSASMAIASEGIDKALNDIYAKYPPDSDLRLSQSQNDTLWILALQYIKQRERFFRTMGLQTDTIVPDTTKSAHK